MQQMSTSNILASAVVILVADFLRYALSAGLIYLLICRAFASRLHHRRILDDAPVRGQIRREFVYSLSTVVIFAFAGLTTYVLQQWGYTRIYTRVAEYGVPYWVLSLVLAMVIHDAYFYWIHRLLHRPKWFMHIHSVHHKSVSPTPWAAYSFHPFEAGVNAVFLPLLVTVVPMEPIAISVFVLHMVLRNCLLHCGVEIMPWEASIRGWLRAITTVSHHHFHHAIGRGNYGFYFTWWDRMCKTEESTYRVNRDTRFS